MNLENEILKIYKLPLSYDNHGQFIVDANEKKVADVRGWGTLQYKKDAEKLQDKLGEMLVEAFNEKYYYAKAVPNTSENKPDFYKDRIKSENREGDDYEDSDDPSITKVEMDGRGGIIIDSVHQIFTFNKEPNGNWYIKLDNWEGSKEDLQMVMGADTMLDRFSEGEDNVKLLISETDFENSYYLKMEKETPEFGGGAYYSLYDSVDEFIMQVWLCRVTEFVFGKLPMNIYIHPVRI